MRSLLVVIIRRRYDILTRHRHIPPVHEDPRTDERAINKVPFQMWEQLNSDNLYCYSITINKILSPTFGTPLEVLQNALIYQYLIPSSIVEKFISFLTFYDLKKISWETPQTNKDVRLPLLFLEPRNRITVSGTYSRYIPHPKQISNDRSGGLDK